MSPQTQALLEAVLALPEEERALLMEELVEALSPPAEEMTDDEFEAELNRRRAEMDAGTVKPIPASEIWLEE